MKKNCVWEIGISIIACMMFIILGCDRSFNSIWVVITWIVAVTILLIMTIKNERLATWNSATLMLLLFSLISVCCMFCAERFIIPQIYLILMGVFFGAVIVFAVVVIWKYKGSAITLKYSLQLFLGMVTIIIGFAGVYMMLYYQYFSVGYDVMTQEGDNNSVLLADSFLWYSVEGFTGTDISNVCIGNVTYDEFCTIVKESGKNDFSEWKAVSGIQTCIRLITSIESLLFMFYISILVAGAVGEGKKSITQNCEDC